MTLQTVNLGAIANDGTGDPARTAFNKTNLAITELNKVLQTEVIVLSASDLPAPIGGFHPLVDNVNYIFKGEVTSADGILFGVNNVLTGASTHYRDKFIYTGTGVALTATNVLLETANLQIVAANGTFISKTGTGNFIIRRGIVNCKDYGMFDSSGIVLIDGCQANVTNTGLKFGAGNVPIFVWSQSTIANSTTDDPLLDLRGASIGYSNLDTVIFSPANFASAACIAGDVGSANITQNFFVSACNFVVPPGQPVLDGITIGDIKYQFNSNINAPDSEVIANAYLSDNAAVTSIGFADTPTLIAGTWLADVNDQRTLINATGGRVTFIGEGIVTMSFTVSGTADNQGGGNQQFKFELFKNGSITASPQHTTINVDGSDENSFAFSAPITLSQSDYVELKVTNVGGTQNVLVRNIQITGRG
jgi:hypothetical protein